MSSSSARCVTSEQSAMHSKNSSSPSTFQSCVTWAVTRKVVPPHFGHRFRVFGASRFKSVFLISSWLTAFEIPSFSLRLSAERSSLNNPATDTENASTGISVHQSICHGGHFDGQAQPICVQNFLHHMFLLWILSWYCRAVTIPFLIAGVILWLIFIISGFLQNSISSLWCDSVWHRTGYLSKNGAKFAEKDSHCPAIYRQDHNWNRRPLPVRIS